MGGASPRAGRVAETENWMVRPSSEGRPARSPGPRWTALPAAVNPPPKARTSTTAPPAIEPLAGTRLSRRGRVEGAAAAFPGAGFPPPAPVAAPRPDAAAGAAWARAAVSEVG